MSPNLVAQPHQPQLSGTTLLQTDLFQFFDAKLTSQTRPSYHMHMATQPMGRSRQGLVTLELHKKAPSSSSVHLIAHHPSSYIYQEDTCCDPPTPCTTTIKLRTTLYNIIATETVTARDISTCPFALAVAVSACGDAGANPSFLRLHRIATHCISFAYTITTTLDDGNPNVHNASTFGSLLRLLLSQYAFHPLSKRISALLFPSNIPTAQCAIDPLRNMLRTPIYAQLS